MTTYVILSYEYDFFVGMRSATASLRLQIESDLNGLTDTYGHRYSSCGLVLHATIVSRRHTGSSLHFAMIPNRIGNIS